MELNIRKIKLELERLGWTKYRLAKEMGVKHQWVYYIIQHPESCTLKTVTKFGEALGIDPRDLVI